MGWVRKRILIIMLVVSLALPLTVSTPVEVSAAQDYLSITLADIIIAWYNAAGVAIGDSEIVNAIYSLYGNITLADLADHDIFEVPDLTLEIGTYAYRKYVKELIGYGNLTVPMIEVNVRKLMNYLGEIPMGNAAKESLEAMFGWEGNRYNEVMFGLLGGVIGSVANIGKIAYSFADEALTGLSDVVKNSLGGKTLYDIYRHFTDTTYFQDLLEEGIPGPGAPQGDLTLNFSDNGFAGIGGMAERLSDGSSHMYCMRVPEHVFGIVYRRGTTTYFSAFNNTSTKKQRQSATGSISTGDPTGRWFTVDVSPYALSSLMTYSSDTSTLLVSGYCIKAEFPVGTTDAQIKQYCREHDPWDAGNNITGVTKYINNAVGNILSDNYINLSPNIGSDEYMYIFDRPTYIETLNQITNNTDNGDYTDNSTIINNYNIEYIQPPDVVPVRPTSAPAPTGQPVQPTVSPRPTQIPEEVSNIIYEGGISEEITKKFPFCIPWDIKAMIDRLWAPDRRAPYIHWDATFGSWGKLGEVDIDLSDFDNAAAIFRSTTLLLWIVGLVIITKHLIG